METLLVVVLVCAATVAPQDCTRANALDVVSRPCSSVVPTACLHEGEFVAADAGLGPADLYGTRTRILAERRRAAVLGGE